MLNSIICDDCKNVFPEIKKKYKNIVVITDPPYNIQFDDYKDYDDNLTDKEYIKLLSLFKGTPAAVIHYPEEIMKSVVPALGIPIEVLAWCYSSNLPKQFRLVNIYHRKPDFSKVLQSYKNLTDARIKQRIADGHNGRPMYDWFDDIQLVKNVSKDRLLRVKNKKEKKKTKEKPIHPCPIPIPLVQRLIKILTTEEDIIVDPFMGSGTTAIAAIKEKRSYIGIEKSDTYCRVAQEKITHCKEGHNNLFNELV